MSVMVAAGVTRALSTGARCDGEMRIDMVKLISFGASAGHLMEELLGAAGVGEVDEMAVSVQPEADGAVMTLLREAAEGRWVVRALDAAGRPDGAGDDIRLDTADSRGLGGDHVDERSEPTGSWVFRGWDTIGQLHLY